MKNLDAAIAYVNAKPNPLALYVYSKKRDTFEYGKGVPLRYTEKRSHFYSITLQCLTVH